jgi:hypothetical protein
VCIFTEWDKNEDRQARVRLIWTQAVHWVAVLVAMNVMLLAGVQQLLPTPATSLVLLMLLALGSFLAGLNLASVELCFLGLVLALAVPTVSWVKQSMVKPERKLIDSARTVCERCSKPGRARDDADDTSVQIGYS